MQHVLSQLNKLNSVINGEKQKYVQAIKENQNLEQVKTIYLRIKDLECKAHTLMQHAADKLDNKLRNSVEPAASDKSVIKDTLTQ